MKLNLLIVSAVVVGVTSINFPAKAFSLESKLTAPDAAQGDQFGRSVSINGDTALVGAFRDDDNGTDSGSAYLFSFFGKKPHAVFSLKHTHKSAWDELPLKSWVGTSLIFNIFLKSRNSNTTARSYKIRTIPKNLFPIKLVNLL